MQGRLVILDTGWQTLTLTGTGSGVYDLLEAKLAATQAGFLVRAKILQSNKSAAADADDIQCAVKRGSGTYTSGSTGVSATVTKGQTGDPAHGMTTATQLSKTQAVAGSGALEVLEPGSFNVLAGEWEYTPTPELMHPIAPSQGIILALDEIPAAALTVRAILEILITHG